MSFMSLWSSCLANSAVVLQRTVLVVAWRWWLPETHLCHLLSGDPIFREDVGLIWGFP